MIAFCTNIPGSKILLDKAPAIEYNPDIGIKATTQCDL
jgi:hypothetical protein